MANGNKTPAPAAGTALMDIKKETADLVLAKVQVFQKQGELDLPPNYSPSNALKSAWLMLQNTIDKGKRPVLESCTKASIANSLLDMVVQGLNPAKKQCYFIPYGSQLTLQRSYLGTKAVCLRVDKSLYDIYAEPVYKGDNLEYSIIRGQRVIEKHTQKLENIDDDNIVAAYAVAIEKDGKVRRCELMTMDQIKKSWKQSKVNPIKNGEIDPDSTHGKFTAEMAKRTVISRLAKHIIGASDDSDLLIQSVRRTDDHAAEAEAQAEVDEHANQEVIDIGSEPDQTTEGEPVIPDKYQPADPLTDEEKAEIEAEEEAAASGGPGF